MLEKKIYLVPVYIIGFSVLIGAAFDAPSVISAIKNRHLIHDPLNDRLRMYFINQLISRGIIYMVMLAECVIYWRIRHKKIKKDFAVGHAVGVALALVALPVGFSITYYFIDLSIPSDETTDTIQIMNALDRGLFTVFLTVAHICFALVLISLWKNRKSKPFQIAAEGRDILNEYADR